MASICLGLNELKRKWIQGMQEQYLLIQNSRYEYSSHPQYQLFYISKRYPCFAIMWWVAAYPLGNETQGRKGIKLHWLQGSSPSLWYDGICASDILAIADISRFLHTKSGPLFVGRTDVLLILCDILADLTQVNNSHCIPHLPAFIWSKLKYSFTHISTSLKFLDPWKWKIFNHGVSRLFRNVNLNCIHSSCKIWTDAHLN